MVLVLEQTGGNRTMARDGAHEFDTDLLRAAIAAAEDGIVITDLNHRLVEVNGPARAMLELLPEDAFASVEEMAASILTEKDASALAAALMGERGDFIRFPFRGKELLAASQPLLGIDGNRRGTLCRLRQPPKQSKEEQRRERLGRLARTLAGCSSLSALSRVVQDETTEFFKWDAHYLAVRRPWEEMFHCPYFIDTVEGERTFFSPGEWHITGRNSTQRRILSGECVLYSGTEIKSMSEQARFGDESHASASIITAPVVSGKAVIGVISVQSYQEHFYTQEDAALLTQFCDIVSPSLERVIAEEALRESEDRFRDILDSASDLIQSVSLDGRIAFANKAWLSTLGYQENDVSSLLLGNVVAPEAAPEFNQAFEQVMAGETIERLETAFLTSKGEKVIVEGRVTPRLVNGEVVALRGIFRNITDRRKAEEQRENNFRRYELLFRLSPSGLLLEDEEGTILDVNPALCEMLAYKREEMIGRKVHMLAHEEVAHLVDKNIQRVLNGEVLRHTVRSNKSGGDECFMVLNEAMMPLPDGRRGIIVASVDITNQVKAERALKESEARFRSLAESAPVMIWCVNPQGKCYYFNRTWLEYTGRRLGEEAGEGWLRGVHPDDVKNLREQHRRHMAERKEFRSEYRLRSATGEYHWVQSSGVPDFSSDGEFTGFIGTCVDIHEQRETERVLREAKDSAEAIARMKTEFLANMSHEIRTPLNGVLGMLQILLEEPLTQQQHDYVQTAKTSGESLLFVINDILDYSKIEAGKMELEAVPFHLRNFAEEMGELMAPLARQRGLEMIVDVESTLPPRVCGDPTRLRQVLGNLLVNAIKFTSEGEVHLHVQLVDPDLSRPRIRFSVKDTGIGIPEDRMHRLFESFTQIDASTTRQYGGTGLGLAICRKLVRLMNSDIEVESELGKGSAFSFTLAMDAVAGGTDTETLSRWAALWRKRVLVVEGTEAVREGIARALGGSGCEALLTDCTDQAWELLVRSVRGTDASLDAVLIDARFGGEKVEAFARKVREHRELKETPLILLASIDEVCGAARLVPDPFDGYLTKPIRQVRLKETLAVAFSRPTLDEIVKDRSSGRNALPILVVDDNPVNQLVGLKLLQRCGVKGEAVSGGKEAVAALTTRNYQMVLMDCLMPQMDGYETTRQIRASLPHRREVPIVAMTGSILTGDRERCFQAGMDDYLCKPLQLEELRRVIVRWQAGTSTPARNE